MLYGYLKIQVNNFALEGHGRNFIEARLEEALGEYTNRTKKFYDLVQIKVKLKNGEEEDRWVAYCNDIDGLQKYVRKERGIDENSESLYGHRFRAIALGLSL